MPKNNKYPLSSMHTKAKHPLEFIFGELPNGEILWKSLASAPHLLVAGTTGSGKSVLLDQISLSIMSHTIPEEVGFIIVDPKMLDFASYNGLPHLVHPVITDPEKACEMLKKLTLEMDRKYEFISNYGKKIGRTLRNIDDYNELFPVGDSRRMAYLVVLIDEFSDLIMMNSEVEFHVIRLGQKGRASGIHVLLCTQTPRADVVTGMIKANIPSRVCLSVASGTDSRVIIDEVGGEKLAGKGDMYVRWGVGSKLIRLQGAYIDNDMRDNIVNYLKKKYKPAEQMILDEIDESALKEIEEDSFVNEAELNIMRKQKMDIVNELLGEEEVKKPISSKKLTMKELLDQRKKGM